MTIAERTIVHETFQLPEIRPVFAGAGRIAVVIWLALLSFHFYGYTYNHPELRWKSVESDHFVVHFYDRTAPFVSSAVTTAEEVYDPLASLYGFKTRKKIDIVLAGYDDMSNGFAEWLAGTVTIWVPDAFFALRGNAPWLRNVITHELAHIFSLRKLPGTQMVYAEASVGIRRPGFDLSVGKVLPMMQLFPNWLAEGLAQRGAARCGNDCWDNRRDMVLRCALLDGKDLSLDRMGVFTHDQLGNEQVYNQGFSFVGYIERMIGDDALHALLREANRESFDLFAVTKPEIFSSLNGRKLDEYYRSWRDSALAAARRKLPVQITPSECVWRKGNLNRTPRVDPRGILWGCLTNNNDDSHRTDLVIAPRGSAEPVRVIKHALASWDFAPKTGAVYFIKSYDPGEHGSFYNELYRCTLSNGKIKRLTRNGRIYAVAVSPTEKEIAVVRFRDAQFSLETFDLSTSTFRVLNEGAPGNPFVAVDYDPGDASKLVVERIVDGRSSLYLVDRGSGSLSRLTGAAAQEESPSWAGNGKIYFSADYDAIFNCYSVKPDGTDLLRHTSVAGGAFEPVLEADGATLLFSEYTSSGFGISRAKPDSMPYSPPAAGGCVFSKPAVSVESSPARPYGLRMSSAWWRSIFAADFASNDSISRTHLDAGILRVQNDPLGKLGYVIGLGATGAIESGIVDTSNAARSAGRAIAATRREQPRLSRQMDSVAKVFSGRPGYSLKTGFFPCAELESGSGRQVRANTSSQIADASLWPHAQIQSNHFGCSIYSSAALRLLLGFYPIHFQSQSTISVQAGRSAFAGITTRADVFRRNIIEYGDTILVGLSALSFPLWFEWLGEGYYNEDSQHNHNGVSLVRLEIAPFSQPGYLDDAGSIRRKVTGFSGGMDVFHAFPITKFTGLPVSFSCGFDYYDSPVWQAYFNEYPYPFSDRSDLFVRTITAAALSFPLIRNIGIGSGCHYDAMYAKIGYGCSVIANRTFLVSLQEAGAQWPDIVGCNFTAVSSDPGFSVSHLLFATVQVNSVSKYIFSGGTGITGSYDLLKNRAGLRISALF